jgi:hypothetical protein
MEFQRKCDTCGDIRPKNPAKRPRPQANYFWAIHVQSKSLLMELMTALTAFVSWTLLRAAYAN